MRFDCDVGKSFSSKSSPTDIRERAILQRRPDVGCLYVHTTDYPMHTWPPDARESKEHLTRLDALLAEAVAAAPRPLMQRSC